MSGPYVNPLLWWVIPGVLCGMAMPFIHHDRRMNLGGALDAHDDELADLYRSGIRAVVSLLNIPSDAAVMESAGFVFSCLFVPVGGVPTLEQADELVRFINAQRAARRPVAVHCEAGIGRTGTMLAVYLVSQGDDATTAIRRIREIERHAIETPGQADFIEHYAQARRRRTGSNLT